MEYIAPINDCIQTWILFHWLSFFFMRVDYKVYICIEIVPTSWRL